MRARVPCISFYVTLSVIGVCHLSVICCYDFRALVSGWMGTYVVHVVARACAAAAVTSVMLFENMVIIFI